MKTMISALLHLMGNPTTSAVLLAALISSNAWMFSENRATELELSKVTAQLHRLVDMQAEALAAEQSKQARVKAASAERWKKQKDFTKRLQQRLKEYKNE